MERLIFLFLIQSSLASEGISGRLFNGKVGQGNSYIQKSFLFELEEKCVVYHFEPRVDFANSYFVIGFSGKNVFDNDAIPTSFLPASSLKDTVFYEGDVVFSNSEKVYMRRNLASYYYSYVVPKSKTHLCEDGKFSIENSMNMIIQKSRVSIEFEYHCDGAKFVDYEYCSFDRSK